MLFQQCAAVSTQLGPTRTPAQWNFRPLKRETCQGCEPRAHGPPEAARSKLVSFPGSSASATGDRMGGSDQSRQGKDWVWDLGHGTGRGEGEARRREVGEPFEQSGNEQGRKA